MKILIIILCIVILLRNKKEGWGWAKKAWEKVKQKARQAAEAAENARKAAAACTQKLIQHNLVITERDLWKRRRAELANSPKYNDQNFNVNVDTFYRNDMFLVNDAIDTNTILNNELNKILTKIKITQTNNKTLLDKLKIQNTLLKECKMNQELTDNDYEVLK